MRKARKSCEDIAGSLSQAGKRCFWSKGMLANARSPTSRPRWTSMHLWNTWGSTGSRRSATLQVA